MNPIRSIIAVLSGVALFNILSQLLEAMLIAMDAKSMLLISGTGDVIEPDEACVAIGSGGPYALAAARALLAHSQLPASEIAREAMRIAGEICIYTNQSITVEEIE